MRSVEFFLPKFYHDIRSAEEENTSLTVADKFELEGLDHGLLLVDLDNVHVTRCIWNKYKALSNLPVTSLASIFTLYHSDMSFSA
jgi:hypothetical protein